MGSCRLMSSPIITVDRAGGSRVGGGDVVDAGPLLVLLGGVEPPEEVLLGVAGHLGRGPRHDGVS